jgi:hypothetical protein
VKRQTYLSARAWSAASRSAAAWARQMKADLDARAAQVDAKPAPLAWLIGLSLLIVTGLAIAGIAIFH